MLGLPTLGLRSAGYQRGSSGALYGMWFDGVDDGVVSSSAVIPATDDFRVTMKVVIPVGYTPGGNEYFANQRTASGDQIQWGWTADKKILLFVGLSVVVCDDALTPGEEVEISVYREGDDFSLAVGDQAVETLSSPGFSVGQASFVLGSRSGAFTTGVFRDLRSYNNLDVLQLRWLGDGNADADWTDQEVGSNDGTVSGNPQEAVSYDGGATWARNFTPGAEAYIEQAEAAGGTATSDICLAWNTLYQTPWIQNGNIRRFVPTIWGVEAANAIEAITGAVGTFTASVTHSSEGWVQGNGTSDEYDFGEPILDMIDSITDGFIGTMNYAAPTGPNQIQIGAGNTSGSSIRCASQNSSVLGYTSWVFGSNFVDSKSNGGVCLGGYYSGDVFHDQFNNASGFDEGSSTVTLTSAAPTQDLAMMHSAGTVGWSLAKIGFGVVGQGLDATDREAMCSDLLDFYEAATGLTAP